MSESPDKNNNNVDKNNNNNNSPTSTPLLTPSPGGATERAVVVVIDVTPDDGIQNVSAVCGSLLQPYRMFRFLFDALRFWRWFLSAQDSSQESSEKDVCDDPKYKDFVEVDLNN